MSERDDGGPAFPAGRMFTVEEGWQREGGMTLRDYFAAKAMQGIVVALHQGIRPADVPRMAADAYGIADAMLAERAK